MAEIAALQKDKLSSGLAEIEEKVLKLEEVASNLRNQLENHLISREKWSDSQNWTQRLDELDQKVSLLSSTVEKSSPENLKSLFLPKESLEGAKITSRLE